MSNKTEPNKMDELLQAIKEGELSKDEIIKRLNSAIDREYSPYHTEKSGTNP